MTSSPSGLDPDVEAWLRAGAGETAVCDKVVETSISWLFFYPDRVLKLRKPVDFGFVDFTTLANRRWAAERELAFNRVTSPTLYRRLLAIGHGAGGEPVDFAVEMRRFDEAMILARRLPLDGAFAEALGRRIAGSHLAAPRGVAGAGASGLRYVLRSNADQLRACAAGLGAERIESLAAATDQAFAGVADLLDERAAEGFCRACHGDLHLANILEEDGAPVLFDCIEFSDRLREIDVQYDIAFLLMDLAFRDDLEAANRAFNGWLDEAARGLPPTIWRGLAALPLSQSVRASVRAHVCARERKPGEAERYAAAAEAHLLRAAPRLVAVGGLSGSGKTTWARRIAPGLGGPPGAVVVRSDEVRKRLWRRAPTDRLPPEAYDAVATTQVYDEMMRVAAAALGAGFSVVVDATFLEPAGRTRVEALATTLGVAFEGVWLDAPADVLRGRLASRRGDASDADDAVLARQMSRDPGPIGWRRSAAAAAVATGR